MPETYLSLSKKEQAQLLRKLSTSSNLTRDTLLLEKDIWICWALEFLFKMPNRLPMAFKGGTSLSKAFRIIDRFSEIEVFSNIALKAQSHSRKTLAILAELKRPSSTTFINQQNNALAQQVNNRDNTSESEKNKNISNELLSEGNHEALESRGTEKTIRFNPNMAAVEKTHRS